MRLTRTDDDQEFSQLGLTLPPGLAAKFAGVTICPDAAIAQAEARTAALATALWSRSAPRARPRPDWHHRGRSRVGVPLTYVPEPSTSQALTTAPRSRLR